MNLSSAGVLPVSSQGVELESVDVFTNEITRSCLESVNAALEVLMPLADSNDTKLHYAIGTLIRDKRKMEAELGIKRGGGR